MTWGTFDFIQEDSDLQRNVELPGRVDVQQVVREEAVESYPIEEGQLMEVEAERKRKWLKAPKEIRIALRRLHPHDRSWIVSFDDSDASHCRRYTEALWKHAVILHVKPAGRGKPVQKAPVTKMPGKLVFNYEVVWRLF